jgi:hypothetical protein
VRACAAALRSPRVTVAWLVLGAAAALLILVACRGGGGGISATSCASPPDQTPAPDPAGDLFVNPSFENGPPPWFSLTTDTWGRAFAVSQKEAHSGSSSAYLQLRSEDGGATLVYGVVQEIAPKDFPEVLSGYYCVERWEKHTPRQYLQFAVIVSNAKNIPPEVTRLGASNHQVRYILAGVDTQPTFIQNARYVLVTRDPPEVGKWVHFERNIKQDFQQLWGDVPAGFTNIRILFEVRWDERSPSDGVSKADVYYDDLYVGRAGGS